MFTSAPRVRCVQLLNGRLSGGVTEPMVVEAIGGGGSKHKLVLKLRVPEGIHGQAHYSASSLAAELVCAMLAQALGLSPPQAFIVDVTREFCDSIADDRLRQKLNDNVGPNFGSLVLTGVTLWRRTGSGTLPKSLLAALEDVLVFDALVLNPDRTLDKPNLLWTGDTLHPIDHSLALFVCNSHEPISEREDYTFPPSLLRRHCAVASLRERELRFLGMFDRWVRTVDGALLQQVRSAVPDQWQHRPGDLDRMFTFLSYRRLHVAALTQRLQEVLTS